MKWEFIVSNSYLAEAFEWHQNSPEFIRNFGDFGNDLNGFIDSLFVGMNFIGLENGVPKAMVHGQIINDRIIEGHLFCSEQASMDFITATVIFAKNKALNKYEQVISHILTKHKMLHTVILRAGFYDTGYRGWYYVYRGRLMEVKYYVAER